MPPHNKPVLSIRRPPEGPLPENVERFVAGAPRPEPSTATPEAAPGPGIVTRQDGRVRRRMTIYLAPDIARALSIHCATEGLQLSDAVATAIAGYLQQAS